jgi:hypothetical protein
MKKRNGWAASALFLYSTVGMPLLTLAKPIQSDTPTETHRTLTLTVIKLPPQELTRFNEVLLSAERQKLSTKPFGQVVQTIAQQFLGATYQDGLLNQTPTETLFLSLKKFDCVLLVETVLAIARNVVQQDNSVQGFAQNVAAQRYRSGQLQGYCSRLHYFSDWIADNEKRGLVQNITAKIGGTTFPKQLNFMSQHRKSYPQLKSDSEYRCIQQVEANLARSLTLSYVPTQQIRKTYAQLQSGDIVAVATAIPGLDVTHTGLVERQANGSINFIHASPGSVVKRATDLQTYVSRVEESVGMIVARPVLH